MKISRLLKILTILAITALVAGCKLAVMVPSGGDVTSESGTRNCAGGSLCEFNITDSTFYEVFTAVARPGYVFSKWSAGGPAFFCGDSTNPNCEITNEGTAGDANIQAIIATGKFFYVMPIFKFVGIDTDGDGIKDHVDADDDNDGVLDADDHCPLLGPNFDDFGCPFTHSIVMVNGRQWYQPTLFKGVGWNAINAVCPAGVCINGGVLNGHDMTGWTWASVEDMNSMFNFYIAGSSQPVMGPGPSSSYGSYIPPEPYRTLYQDGFIPTGEGDSTILYGWSRDLDPVTSGTAHPLAYLANHEVYTPIICMVEGACVVAYSTNTTRDAGYPGGPGAWFFRAPP